MKLVFVAALGHFLGADGMLVLVEESPLEYEARESPTGNVGGFIVGDPHIIGWNIEAGDE